MSLLLCGFKKSLKIIVKKVYEKFAKICVKGLIKKKVLKSGLKGLKKKKKKSNPLPLPPFQPRPTFPPLPPFLSFFLFGLFCHPRPALLFWPTKAPAGPPLFSLSLAG
jgi:hypothetical protein